MNDDEDETTTVVYTGYSPIWRFSRWDVIAATLHGVGGTLHMLSQAVQHVAQSASAHANWVRQNWELEEQHAHQEAVEAEVEAHMSEIVGLPQTTTNIPEAEQ